MKKTFPFGQMLNKVVQKDRAPKKIFVLGVYASAVHARWVGAEGVQKVAALAVASEPEIFWRGENAEKIIAQIQIPKELGKLLPANRSLNGPSGRALDDLFLIPLGFDRREAWLCDLLPESRINPNQRKAIDKHYTKEIIEKYNLAPVTIPDFFKQELNSDVRRQEILAELEESQADRIILLGDLPIKYFLSYFNSNYSKLSDFGETPESYGRKVPIEINGRTYGVFALCHPRQAGKLGHSSSKWGDLHNSWIKISKAF
jgi:hypothetical protein